MEGFDLWEILGNADYAAMLREGIRFTFIVFVGSWLLAMSLGSLLLVTRQLPGRLPNAVVTAYISYHRNVPTLVQLMLWYFGISSLLPTALQYWLTDHNGETLFAIVALGLCQAAYFSEDLRSGLRSIPPGQAEAAKALGHGHVSSMRYVMMPQAVRNALPALINHTVSLFKNSSLAMAIGVAELTHAVQEVQNLSFRVFEAYTVATILYLAFSLVLMAIGAGLQMRAARRGGR
jgi:polar amino acid transport system permease protein